jgi:CRISPR/Cas system-associated endonuclease Cas3-HD
MSDVKNDSIKKLQDNRQAIHFIELAGLLHDIGKLGAAFLEYRKTCLDSDATT